MEPEQLEEFDAVREAAFDALRCGTLVGKHRSVPVCQYLILPSFENPISWDVKKVTSPGEGTQTRLYRSTWRMDVDSQVMNSPVERMRHPRPYKPTLETDWVLVDAKELEGLLSRVQGVRLPLISANARSGCDGTTFELTFGDFYCNARIGWWCDIPKEWQELAPVVTELQRLFEIAWERGRS